MAPDADAAGRLAEHGDVVRVAAECGDVVPDPAQRGLLVHQTVVADLVVLGVDGRVGEEAEDVDAVVERDEDDAAVPDQRGRVVVVAPADEQPPAGIHTMTGRRALPSVPSGAYTLR